MHEYFADKISTNKKSVDCKSKNSGQPQRKIYKEAMHRTDNCNKLDCVFLPCRFIPLALPKLLEQINIHKREQP